VGEAELVEADAMLKVPMLAQAVSGRVQEEQCEVASEIKGQ